MTWQEAIAYTLVVIGLVAGGYIAAQRPTFWVEFGARTITAIFPVLSRFVAKRMTPEDEAEWRKAERAGRGDEWRRRRLGLPPKG